MAQTPDLFGTKPRRPARKLLRVYDAGSACLGEDEGSYRVVLYCQRCGHRTGWCTVTRGELNAGIPCPQCNH